MGKFFDYWEVIDVNGAKFTCRCKCGKQSIIPKSRLISGKTKSCRDCTFIRKYDGIKGKIYGQYEVISEAYKKDYNNGKYIFVKCKCLLCGHIQEMPVSSLISGERSMCQKCAAKINLQKANEVNIQHKFDNNIYEEKENYYILHIGDVEVLFDKDDYDLVKGHVWRIIDNYVYTGHLKDTDFISMHHMILNKAYNNEVLFDTKHQTDHINRNGYDNRKNNMRIVAVDDNLKNRGMFRNNTSGCKGVSFVSGLWRASIGCNNVKYELGNFDNYEDAVRARKNAEDNLWEYINNLKSDNLFLDENGGVLV